MKRLLALILVISWASVANATFVLQISVNGEKEPVDSEICAMVSEHLTLDIWTDGAIGMFEGEIWMLVCDTGDGDISGGQSYHPWMTITGNTEDYPGVIPPPDQEGIWGNVFNLDTTPIPAGTVLADSIDFHCVSGVDCVVSLYQVVEGVPASVLFDQVIIHGGVPEPATILLLGLGGLFLRRRK